MAILVYSPSAGAVAKSTNARVIDAYGTWTLQRLGYGDQVVTQLRKASIYGWDTTGGGSVAYNLPSRTAQGKRGWYLLKLHYKLVLGGSSGDGLVRIFAGTSGRTAAMIDFEVDRKDDEVEVTRLGLSLVGGSFRETARRTVWEGTYTNFLQIGGVRPGRNSLWFDVAERGDAVVEELRVFADSAIIYQPGGMAALRLTPSLSDRDIRVGEPFSVDYVLRNTGGTAVAPGGGIWVTPLAEGLCVLGTDTKELGKIAPGKTVRGSFLLRADRPGQLPFELEASTFGGSPVARLEANVHGVPSAGEPCAAVTAPVTGGVSDRALPWGPVAAGVGLGLLAVVAIVVAVAVPRRRTRAGIEG